MGENTKGSFWVELRRRVGRRLHFVACEIAGDHQLTQRTDCKPIRWPWGGVAIEAPQLFECVRCGGWVIR